MRVIVYTGFNNPRTYKRGVENVIATQACAAGPETRKFYLFFDETPSVFRWDDIVCVGIPKGVAKFCRMNAIVNRIAAQAERRGGQFRVHSHHHLMTAFLTRRTDLLTVHDGLWYLKKCFHSRAPWLFWAMERWLYRRSDAIHCNSRFTYETSQLPDVGREAKVIHCTTPLEFYAGQGGGERTSVRDRWDVLAVRSIEERARIDLIVEAAALAQARGLAMRFIVCGKGPLLEHYRAEVRERGLKNIKLAGFVSDEELMAHYRCCDCVLVTCEDGEGFGMPIIEGYLFDKPVVASNRCAIPEVICDKAWLVENSAEEIVSRLEAAQRNPRGGLYREYYEERFSFAVISRQFASLYEDVFRSR